YGIWEMNVRWLTTKAVALLLALPVYSGIIFPQITSAEVRGSPAPLRFGQSIALSDFDADGLIDIASLDSSSLHKRVSILLTTGKLSFLHFTTKGISHGSLFARDVDSDGTTDLIWSDLVHAEDVVVWLGDGLGLFKRSEASVVGEGFTLADTRVTAPDESDRETALNSEINRRLDQTLVQKCLDRTETECPDQRCVIVTVQSPALSQPTDRGPPFIL